MVETRVKPGEKPDERTEISLGFYARYIKRPMDFFLALCAIIVLSPLLLILTIAGAIIMKGNPFFTQLRPGKDEKIFKLIKFRTMTCETDENNVPLPDELRLKPYGRLIRSLSLDELPELINILKGDMSVIGPRPQLVRDMVFMTEKQRHRHDVRPGLSGLAQANGRNVIAWDDKLEYDLKYIERITFLSDWKIIFLTIIKVFRRSDISAEGMDTSEDYGDYLLRTGRIEKTVYFESLDDASRLIKS